jgi:hypothetical protein
MENETQTPEAPAQEAVAKEETVAPTTATESADAPEAPATAATEAAPAEQAQ